MAIDKKISELSSGAPAQGGDEYVIARSGANYKLTGTNLLGLVTGTANTFTAAQTFNSGNAKFAGATSGTITVNATATAGTNTLTLPAATDTVAVIGTAQTFTAAQTFRAANAVRSEAASTQDAIVLAGRAGGTSSYAVTLTPATLSASTTLTLPNVTDTVATIGTAQTFTAAQTFRASNAVRSEAASTQDAMVLAGRAGGTNSYAVTLTPTTLSASRTVTFPDAATNIPVSSQTLTFSGPTAARTVTLPDESFSVGYRNIPQSGSDKTSSYSLTTGDVGKFVGVGTSGSITVPNSTFAAGDVVSIFNNTSGNVTLTMSITTAYIAGTNTDKDTLTLATRGVATILFISGTVCVVSGNVT